MSRLPDRDNTERVGRHRRDAANPRTIATFGLAASLAVLAAAAAWLVYSARQPRPLTGVYRSGRLLTVERPFPAGGRFAGDPYVGSSAAPSVIPVRLHFTRDRGTHGPSGLRAAGPLPGGWMGRASPTPKSRVSSGPIDATTASCRSHAGRRARSRNALRNTHSGRAITPRRS